MSSLRPSPGLVARSRKPEAPPSSSPKGSPDGQPRALRLGRFTTRRTSNLRVAAPPSPTLFWTIVVTTGLLCMTGLVFVLSSSMVAASHTKSTSGYWFYRQALFLGLGAVLMWIGSRIDYHRFVRLGPAILIASAAALFLVLLPTPLRHTINGSTRWLGPDVLSFQPSELAKLGLILWLAGLLERRRPVMRDWRATVLPALVGCGTVAALILAEPDLGTTTLIAVITFVMLAVAGARLDAMAAMSVPVIGAGVAYSMTGYHRERLLAFMDPWKHASNAGWQTLQSQVGLASGGFFGVGLGNSKAKWGFLPEAHTDFIFAIIGEELGLIGCVAVIGLFLVFLTAGVNAGRRSRDLSGLLVAVGISCWIGFQALINIGVAVGALPNKGITLPFVSYGGTSLMMTMFAAGILLNIARQPGTVAPSRSAPPMSGPRRHGDSTIVIAGGGTAGHVLPGLAIAAALVAGGRDAGDVVFVGSARGPEADLVPAAGFEVVLLPGRGIVRKLSRQNIGAVWGLMRAQATMVGWIRRVRPSVVVCLGGYASVAASLAAVLWRVPIVVAEQNARAGAANRLLGRFARVCAVPVPGTDLPRAVVTGNPVRDQILAVAPSDATDRIEQRRAARAALGIDADRKVVAVFAGSLGARRINEAVIGLAEDWAGRSDVWIRHVIGARDWDTVARPDLRPAGIRYEAVRYEDRMDQLLAAADVAVCRSGGTTVAELGVVGLPALLVPLPIAPRDHQRANAAELVAAGGAVLVDDAECTAARLADELGPLLEDDARREAMTEAARSCGRPDAAAAVADLALRAAAGGRW